MNRITRRGRGWKVIPALLAVMISLIGVSTQVAYAETAGGVGVDGSSSDKGQVSEVRDGDCKIRTDNCSWEISLYYKGAFRGSFLACSDGTKESASPGGLNNAMGQKNVIDNTKYLNSQGIRIARGTSDTKGAQYSKTTPRFTDEAAIKGWGTDAKILTEFIFNNIAYKNMGLFPKSEKDKMIQMVKDFNKADPATKAAKFASGEWFPYFVTMRPVMLVFRKGVFVSNDDPNSEGYCDGGIEYTFEFNNREQQWDKYHNSLRGYYNWEYIVQRMNNPQHNEEHHPGDYGQPHEWPLKDITYSGPNPDRTITGSETGKEGNYYIFFFGEKSEVGGASPDMPPPTPTPPPLVPGTPPEYDVLRIREHELLAAIPTNFEPATNKSNAFADSVKDIQVKEKSNTEVSRRTDRIEDYGTCSEYDCHSSECHCGSEHMDSAGSSDDPSTPEDESSPPSYSPCPGAGCSICGSTLWHAFYCYENYTFEWSKTPGARMKRDDLKSVSNVTATGTDRNNSSMNKAHTVREYEITRNDNKMDIEFLGEDRVNNTGIFKQFTWNNYHPNGKQVVEGTGSTTVSSTTGWLIPEKPAEPPEPFKDGFGEVINSHRFSKYDTAAPLPKEKLLPLASYMNDTAENQKYITWMNARGLAIRSEWILNEKNPAIIKDIYDGTYAAGESDSGINITWGHGGDGGTSTSDSDLLWSTMTDECLKENGWWWSREHKPSDTPYAAGCPSDESAPTVDHKDLPNNMVGDHIKGTEEDPILGVDEIKTPRAVLGRTLVVEPTIRGEAIAYGKGSNAKPLWDTVDGSSLAIPWSISKGQAEKTELLEFKIPSLLFSFSPTYRMYADYELDADRDNGTPVWMLASDVDSQQFYDTLNFSLTGGETIVRAPWSRDYEDRNARDPNNSKKKINVMKAGQAYTVETKSSQLTITATVHYWDEKFWEGAELAAKQKDNKIVDNYAASIKKLAEDISDKDFSFYTNLVGGTSDHSPFRDATTRNGQIFEGDPYPKTVSPADLDTQMKIKEPKNYPKLRLNPDIKAGYVENHKLDITIPGNPIPKEVTPIIDRKWRLDGGGNSPATAWDSPSAKMDGDGHWTEDEMRKWNKTFAFTDLIRLNDVLIEKGWYVEDYEGIKVAVITATIEIPAVRSCPATVYEKLSDFQTPMNKWAPQMTHPNIINDDASGRGQGRATVIPAGSVGAGTVLTLPEFTIYPGGKELHKSRPDEKWSLCYEPFLFGVRGSVFDN